MRTRNSRSRKGFTLTELIVVIVILGILASIGATSFTAFTRRTSADAITESATRFNSALLPLAAKKAVTEADASSRNAATIIEMFEAGDGPKGVTVSTLNTGKTAVSVIWDGSTMPAAGKTVLQALGTGYPTYLQFVKNGASACLRLSADGSMTNDTSSTAVGSAVPLATGIASGTGWIVLARVAKGSSTSPTAANACNLVAAVPYTDAGTGTPW